MNMFTAGVFVGPVYHAALVVPFIFPIEPNHVALSQGIDPGSEINIVGDQYHVTTVNLHQKTLMSAAYVIVGEQFDDLAESGNLDIAPLTGNHIVK